MPFNKGYNGVYNDTCIVSLKKERYCVNVLRRITKYLTKQLKKVKNLDVSIKPSKGVESHSNFQITQI